jgi:hypothetical protein
MEACANGLPLDRVFRGILHTSTSFPRIAFLFAGMLG